MQSVVNGSCWSGKTFAVAATISGDKKPRSRRTREERKSMVETFIKKYQTSNNGKFPSLNLTHKEVGGSFYTVREIVREIIQQNRVLGPGDSTLKVLNLEYCPEEQASEYFSMESSMPLSISTINLAIDQKQGENFSLCNAYERTSPEIIKADGSVNQESNGSHANVAFVSQYLQGEQYHEVSDGAYQDEKLEDLSCKELNPGGVTDGDSRTNEQTLAEVEIAEDPGNGEHPVSSCEDVSVTPSICGSALNDNSNINKSNGTTTVITSSADGSSIPLLDSLSETKIILNAVSGRASSCREDLPLEAIDDKPQNIVGVTTSIEGLKTCDSDDEIRAAFVPFEKDSFIVRSESTETLISNAGDEVSAECAGKRLSLEKDSIIDMSETIDSQSSIALDEVSNQSPNGPVPQNADSPELGSTRYLAQPLFQHNDLQNLENVITNFKGASGESVQPSVRVNTYSEVKGEHENVWSNIGSARNHGSISQNEAGKESDTSETNPVWAAIKSMLNAVVKFWTE